MRPLRYRVASSLDVFIAGPRAGCLATLPLVPTRVHRSGIVMLSHAVPGKGGPS